MSCFLIQNKVIGIESLLDVKEPVEYPMDGIIESLIPKYISKSVRTYVKDYVKNNFKSEKVKKSKLHEMWHCR